MLVPCLLFLKGHHKNLDAQAGQFYGSSRVITTANNNSTIVHGYTINTTEQAILSFFSEEDDDDNESCSEKKKPGSFGSIFRPAINIFPAQQFLSFNPCKSFYKHYSYLSPGIYIFNREIII